MKKSLLCLMVAVATMASCKKEDQPGSNPVIPQQAQKSCTPIVPTINRALHAKVLVVPANVEEYNYFKQIMGRYSYNAQSKDYGMRYSGKIRSNLVVTLLKPGKKVTAKYGIIQLKGHTSDMDYCLAQARGCIVLGQTIVVSGGCESSKDVCMYVDMKVPAFTVSYIGRGPVNDYLVLQMQSLLQDNSYAETLRKLKDNAPTVMASYVYPQ